ncbi:MAG: FecR domain-containing protein, partial [Pseudohongiellaceae bacterium]
MKNYLATVEPTYPSLKRDSGLGNFALIIIASTSLIFAQIPVFAQTNSGTGDQAGYVVVVNGSVIARDDSGIDRALGRRSIVRVGDTILTDTNSSTQLRMVDGAIIALKELTQFSLVEYRYEQNTDSDSVSLELLQGGFRTITGTVGDQRKEAYRANIANFATIGIRGTSYEVSITNAGVMFTGVYDGGTVITNNGGGLDLGVGADYDFARIENQNTPPEGLLVQAAALGNIEISILSESSEVEESEDAPNPTTQPSQSEDETPTSSTGLTAEEIVSDEIIGLTNSDAGAATTNDPVDGSQTSGLLNGSASGADAAISPNEFGNGLAACSGNSTVCQNSDVATTDTAEDDVSLPTTDTNPQPDSTPEPDQT